MPLAQLLILQVIKKKKRDMGHVATTNPMPSHVNMGIMKNINYLLYIYILNLI